MKLSPLLLAASILWASLTLLSPAATANPAEVWEDMLIIVDKDPKGTNMRSAPGGKILDTIPAAPPTAPYLVSIAGADNGWFKVIINGQQGWMHGSVLGTCSGASEVGLPFLFKQPDTLSGEASPRLPYLSRLTPLDIVVGHDSENMGNKGWLKARYADAKGNTYEGWLPYQLLSFAGTLQGDCAAVWAGHR